jgi:hypothetical protein
MWPDDGLVSGVADSTVKQHAQAAKENGAKAVPIAACKI